MARMRSIKPEFWDDRKLARSTSRDARLLYIALWNQSDEHSRLNGDTVWLKGHVFPYDDDVEITQIDVWLDQLEGAGRIERYRVGGDPFIYLPKLAKHQRLDTDKVQSRLPSPDEADQNRTPSEQDPDQSEKKTDELESRDDQSTLSMLHVAGGIEHVGDSAPSADPAPIKSRRERATRIADDWRPTEADIDWQRSRKIPDDLARREAEKFGNYWRARSSNATSLNWSLTWHNWLLKAIEQTPNAPRTKSAGYATGGSLRDAGPLLPDLDPLASAR